MLFIIIIIIINISFSFSFKVSPTWPVPIQNFNFWNLWIYYEYLVRLLGRGISPTQGLYLRRKTQQKNADTHIHASSGIRTHDPSVQVVEDSTCLRPRGAIGTCTSHNHSIINVISYELDDRGSVSGRFRVSSFCANTSRETQAISIRHVDELAKKW